MAAIRLAEHVIDEASGALDVITPPIDQNIVASLDLEQRTVQLLCKHCFRFHPGRLRFLIDKLLRPLEQLLELSMEIAVHHRRPQLVLHSVLHGLELRMIFELLGNENFGLAQASHNLPLVLLLLR